MRTDSMGALDSDPTIAWLMRGDPAIRWQTMRDLLSQPSQTWEAERKRVAQTGWGVRLLNKQKPDGNWGRGPYHPKWTCTTYTMQVLRRLGLPPRHSAAVKACRLYLSQGIGEDGGINFWKARRPNSETCVTGIILSQLAYFKPRDVDLSGLVDYLLNEQMPDGGWNCERHNGAVHSSFHTTINVLEGLREYILADGSRVSQAIQAEARGQEFLLDHRLYRSSTTGNVVHPAMTRFHFPPRWRHDVLRALDHFQMAFTTPDQRMADAIDLVISRRRKDGRWLLPSRYKGAVFFEMEVAAKPSRWNTLRALRVLNWWESKHAAAPRRPR
ncbi:MAG: hypothetical protein JSW51_08260 [Gemmatimonadota bacterium]|nr:MAG: hypothetical protein JSW51_08260 [Gemmatimonadota bacterium]